MAVVYPVIMSGGSGTRLWPLSRKSRPKQYHDIVSDVSMLSSTLARMAHGAEALAIADPIVICAEAHRDIVLDQCRQQGIAPRAVIIEPFGRNTAPAAAIAAMIVKEMDPDGLILLLPADHHVENPVGFWQSVAKAVPLASDGYITTLGIQPTHPETGYGYIKTGDALGEDGYKIDRFAEKPDAETAQHYLDDGSYFWNAGIFLFSAKTMLEEFTAHAGDISNACVAALGGGKREGIVQTLDSEAFAECRSESIDYAIMEATRKGAIVAPVSVGWNDIGAWSAVSDLLRSADPETSVCLGDVIAIDTSRSYVRSDGPVVATIGVEDLIVIATEDAILVSHRDRSQDVKKVVDLLKQRKATHLL